MAMLNNSLASPSTTIPAPMTAMAPVPSPLPPATPVPIPPPIGPPLPVPAPLPGVPAAAAAAAAVRPVIRVPIDVEFARQDAYRACNPDIERPFASFEDACHRLLPFHVLADYDADDVNDKFLDSTGRVLSRSQLWNESLTAKIIEFKSAFQKQVDAFNVLCKRKADGEIRAEEGLMLEQLLFHDEKKKVMEVKMEMERERAETIAAQAERARAEQVRLQEVAMMRQAQAQVQAQAQAQAIHSGRIGSQAAASGGYVFPETNRAANAAAGQVQEEGNATLRSASPEQEGGVADMLNGWNEEANDNINFLAPHSGSEAGHTLDLNSLTSTR